MENTQDEAEAADEVNDVYLVTSPLKSMARTHSQALFNRNAPMGLNNKQKP